MRRQRRELHVLESMYCKARQHGDIVTSCAVTYFRTQALKDADHPDFLADWIWPPRAVDLELNLLRA